MKWIPGTAEPQNGGIPKQRNPVLPESRPNSESPDYRFAVRAFAIIAVV